MEGHRLFLAGPSPSSPGNAATTGYAMWVGVDAGNDVAPATYRSAGGKDDGSCSVVTWDFT